MPSTLAPICCRDVGQWLFVHLRERLRGEILRSSRPLRYALWRDLYHLVSGVLDVDQGEIPTEEAGWKGTCLVGEDCFDFTTHFEDDLELLRVLVGKKC